MRRGYRGARRSAAGRTPVDDLAPVRFGHSFAARLAPVAISTSGTAPPGHRAGISVRRNRSRRAPVGTGSRRYTGCAARPKALEQVQPLPGLGVGPLASRRSQVAPQIGRVRRAHYVSGSERQRQARGGVRLAIDGQVVRSASPRGRQVGRQAAERARLAEQRIPIGDERRCFL